MTPQEQHAAANSIEASTVRRARQAARSQLARRGRDYDVLAERQRLIAFWKDSAKTNDGYRPHNGKWWWVFTWNRCFRCLVLPGARAVLDARDKAEDAARSAELREQARQYRQLQAERAAAKVRAKAPQAQLFGGASA